ncbi:hypothetical protein FRC11_002599, partial [Ceratobasidium sp. 423]
MGYTRGYSTHIASVNKLPTEILSYIFHLASANINPCHIPSSTDSDASEKRVWYPNCLAQVCSRWYDVATSLPSLWTHIDLIPGASIGGGSMDSARAYAQRAGNMPLEVHLDDKRCTRYHELDTLEATLQSLAPRMKALDFIIAAPRLLDFHGSVLNSIIPGLSPGVFKKLHVRSEAALPRSLFFWSHEVWVASSGDGPGPNILKLTNDVIDDRFSGVTSLHLQGIFFDWSRGLYHGLVDLRLNSPATGRASPINAFVLVSILSQSRGLRIFHFSLNLSAIEDADDVWFVDPGVPVSLPDLEVVQVSTTRVWSNAASLLRLIAPGSKPLRLTIETGPYEDLLRPGGINEFFARSRVEKLCIRDANLSVNELRLCSLPDLKVLVFDSCHRMTIEA